MSPLVKVVSALAAVAVAVAAVFVVGMRAKSRLVLDAVRKASRAMKPFALKSAGTAGAYASVIHHVGRRSGRTYETPVVAVPTADGFAIALPYGPNTDWLNNVLAKGSAVLVTDGRTYAVDDPEVVSIDAVGDCFPAKERRQHRRFRVTTCLRVRRATPVSGPAH